MRFQTEPPDPEHNVSSGITGYYFHCPTVEALDQNIRKLLDYIGPHSNVTPKYKEIARRDIDRLLERRLWLMMAIIPHPVLLAAA